MGPTQSSMAWGCAEEMENHQDGFPRKQGDGQENLTTHQVVKLEEDHLASQPHNSDTENDSHRVSVNPMYEFALCRKIKETFRTEGLAEQKEQTEKKEVQGSPIDTRKDSDGDPVVSVQPKSSAGFYPDPHTETDTDKNSPDVRSVHTQTIFTIQPYLTTPDISRQSHIDDQIKGERLMENELKTEEVNHDHRDMADNEFVEISQKEIEALKANETQYTGERIEIIPFQNRIENTELSPLENQILPAKITETQHQATNTDEVISQVETQTQATQTTQAHPGDISLSQSPPRPLMISVSTPPDETSPMFCKLSEMDSCLYEDTMSSPDVDGSEAGYLSRFGSASQDGGAAAAAGASGNAVEPGGARRKSSAKMKKREEKSIDYVLRTMGNLSSPQEKLSALCKKYTELHEDQKGLQVLLKQHQRKMTVILREKDQLQSEHNKNMMAKIKLESLCRELQKQNKTVKEESLQRLKEEEEKRKQMSSRFQKSIAEIQVQVTENHEQNMSLRDENQELSSRLKTFLQQHELRELQMDKLTQHRDLELQLAQARLEQAAVVLKEEQCQHMKEKELFLLQANEGQKKNDVLEAQLDKYKDRYEDFQETISKSSEMFHKLKADMDKMGKRIKKLEKDGEAWKTKYETSNKALQDLTEEKSQYVKERQTLQTKVTTLESLCRALQTQLRQASRTADDSCSSATFSTPSSMDDTPTSPTTTAIDSFQSENVSAVDDPHLPTLTCDPQDPCTEPVA